MKEDKTKGYDLANKIPKYSTLIYVTLQEGLSLEYVIENQEVKRVYIRETQDKLPKNKNYIFSLHWTICFIPIYTSSFSSLL